MIVNYISDCYVEKEINTHQKTDVLISINLSFIEIKDLLRHLEVADITYHKYLKN